MADKLTYESIYNLIKDFKGANKSRYKNIERDVPTKYYFRLFFYFQNGGLLDNRFATDDEMTPKGKKLAGLWKYDTAKNYLIQNCEEERAELLDQFINLLSEINSTTPWYFSEIDGLSEALTRKQFIERDFKIEENRPMITIKCLPDSIDDRIGTLLDLYKAVCFSYYQKKEIVPANLRKFTMGIYIFQTPKRSVSRKDLQYSSLEHNDESSTYKANSKYFEFVNCEFILSSNASAYQNLNNKEGTEHNYEIGIMYDDVFEESYNGYICRHIGDLIETDINYLRVSDARRDIIKSVAQSDKDNKNISSLKEDIQVSRKEITHKPFDKEIRNQGLFANTKFGRKVIDSVNYGVKKTSTVIENYSVSNLIDTGIDYLTDKADKWLNTELLNMQVKGNHLYDDKQANSEMIQNIKQANILGMVETGIENGWIKKQKDVFTPKKEQQKISGNLKDFGSKSNEDIDISKIIWGNFANSNL